MEFLLKASTVIFIFYTCYKLFLQRETFFNTNRWFLLTGLLIAIVLPFVIIPIYIEYVPVIQNFVVPSDAIATQTDMGVSFDWKQMVYSFYGVGVLFFLVKLGVEFSSLLILLRKNKSYKNGDYTFIETDNNMPPFSFFKNIVYNRNLFNETELDHIINHEKVHANQYHSIDVIIAQFASAVFWFNPFVWLYKKELQQNLEFIADKEAQDISKSEKGYQTLLLKASLPNYQLALANNFYNSLIKKRIVMLHKSKSNKLNVWKYALVLPVLALFLMSANTKKIYVEKAVATTNQNLLADPSYENDLNHVLNSTLENKDVAETSKEITTSNLSKEKPSKAPQPTIQAPKVAKALGDIEMVMVTKDLSDADLEAVKKQLKEKGITAKFRGIKRNSDNEITAIKIDVSSENSNANYHTESDEPIKPIKISFDTAGKSISVGNVSGIHSGDHTFAFVSKDGGHKIHKAGKADNVFFISGDDDDDHVEKIVIRSSGKGHTVHSAGKAIWVPSDDHDTIEIEDNIIIAGDDDTDTLFVKKMNKGNVVWMSKEDDHEIKLGKDGVWTSKDGKYSSYAFGKSDGNAFFFASDDEKSPLFILNGKEISKKEMDELDSKSIEKVEVLKGDSATEKYGDKGKNGVVLITTKDKE